MSDISIEDVKALRNRTGLSVSKCKEALEEADGDMEKAQTVLRGKMEEMAEKKADRETKEGVVASYVHDDHKSGAMIELLCETDFVARNEDFRTFAHELCLHITAMEPQYLRPEDAPDEEKEQALLTQAWIKDQQRTIQDLLDEYIALVGENIRVNRFTRYAI